MLNSRKYLSLILTVMLCVSMALFAFLPGVSAEEGKDVVVIGVPANRPPIFYIDEEDDQVTGIGIDLMAVACEKAGLVPKFVSITEDDLKDALDNDKYDLLMPFGSAIKSTKGKSIVVSDNLNQTPFTLVTEENKKLSSLNQLKVGMLASLGGVAETVKQFYPGIQISMYENMAESIDALRSGEVDALLNNSYVWNYTLQKPAYSDLTVQTSTMFTMDFRVGAVDTEKGRALIERLNQGISGVSETRRQSIVLDYTSRRLYRYEFSDYMHEYGLIVLLAFLLVVSCLIIAFQRVHELRKEQELKVQQLMDIDTLTGVLTTHGFRQKVQELLKLHPDTSYLVGYINIRNFKFINDSLGRAAGDELLRFLADKSSAALTEKETFARLEGDHFAILREIGGEESIERDDKEVMDRIRTYFTESGRGNRVQICCGLYVLTPEDYDKADVNHMLDCARVAEQRVRDSRTDGYDFYNPEQWKKGQRIVDIVNHLPDAIRDGEIQVWYQPQIDFDKKKIIGAEALCRWNHDKLGWLSPSEFIPIMEEAGLIYELDSFVWNKVCADLKRWNEMGLHRSVSVNLSRCDIKNSDDIPAHFDSLIKKYGLTPDQLRVEITETAYVESPKLMTDITVKLKALGFQVEMDDFGSGYSSLHMLKELPVDRIKLDLYFLTETGDQKKGSTIVEYIIQMGKALGMTLIAEGVEKIEQAMFLQKCGCSEMQGYYFYKPMNVGDFDKLGTEIE